MPSPGHPKKGKRKSESKWEKRRHKISHNGWHWSKFQQSYYYDSIEPKPHLSTPTHPTYTQTHTHIPLTSAKLVKAGNTPTNESVSQLVMAKVVNFVHTLPRYTSWYRWIKIANLWSYQDVFVARYSLVWMN